MEDSPFDLQALLRAFLPADGGPVAAAVSGGPDSMALGRALSLCGICPVHILTVDHGLRPEAAAEAAQVGQWVGAWPGVRHAVLTRVPDSASRMMERARHDRYRLLAAYCAEHGIDRLFTAHHQDDQAETFLFRLAKGSGLDGLGAMRAIHRYDGNLQIMRPFLDVPKEALVSYCQKENIPFVVDPSNDDSRFARPRLRAVRDALAQEGLTAKRLAVTAMRLARARQALDFYAEKILLNARVEINPDRIVLVSGLLEGEPEEIRLRVLAGMMDRIADNADYGPRMERLEELADRLFNDPSFRKASLGGCLVAFDRKKGLVIVEKEQKNVT